MNLNAILTDDIHLNPGYTFNTDGTVTTDGTIVDNGWLHWTPIGTPDCRYAGTFDGQGHIVGGMYINNNNSYQGLFGYIGSGTAKNLGVTNAYLSASSSSGGVAGVVDGMLSNCYNTATVECSSDHIGGVVGRIGANGTVKNCYNTSIIQGDQDIGGVAGAVYGELLNCYYLSTCNAAGAGTTKTAEEFASGAVAYLLQRGVPQEVGEIWGQTLGENGDAFPVFATVGNNVYYGYVSCAVDAVMVYTNNSAASEEKPDHNFDAATHICDICGVQKVATVGETCYFTFSEALSNWTDGTTLTLFADIPDGTVAEKIMILDKTVTLDLNGHILDMSSVTTAIQIGNKDVFTSTKVNGALTVVDSGENGSIKAHSSSIVVSCGTLDLEGGTLNAHVPVYESGTFNMSGGSIDASSNAPAVNAYGTVNISGGSIRSIRYGIWTYTGTILNISGSPEIIGGDIDSGKLGSAIYVAPGGEDGAKVTISGTPTLRGGSYGEIYAENVVTLYTQPADGTV